MLPLKHAEIIKFVKENPSLSSKEIHDGLKSEIGYATVKRILTKLISQKLISPIGSGRGRKYVISPAYDLFYSLDIEEYFNKEVDERIIKNRYNANLIRNLLNNVRLFTDEELQILTDLQQTYQRNISRLTPAEYAKELERLAIDLSWKSSQIEGNTYSLLETERLLKEKETAEGKTKDEAIMLLNHKDALDFIIEDPNYLMPLSIARIEEIHSILVKDLGIDRNIRNRRGGRTGTNYVPLDNEFQIREALQDMCDIVKSRDCVFEKALLLLVLISYIQPFSDGNKRVARIIGNAILIDKEYCPISFRTIDSIDYKKAMLLFYEQNNITRFKEIFISQFEFAVLTYF